MYSCNRINCDEKYTALTADITSLHFQTAKWKLEFFMEEIINPIQGTHEGTHVSQWVLRSLAEGSRVTSTIAGHKLQQTKFNNNKKNLNIKSHIPDPSKIFLIASFISVKFSRKSFPFFLYFATIFIFC